MLNTTMQDALTDILTRGANAQQLEGQTDDMVLSSVKATRRKLTKQSKKPAAKPAAAKNPFREHKKGFPDSPGTDPMTETPIFGPRYVDPKRKNPFSVHAYPVVSVPPDAKPEIQKPKQMDVVPKVEEPTTNKPDAEVPVETSTLASKPDLPDESKPVSEDQPENLRPVLVTPPTKEDRLLQLVEQTPVSEPPALPEPPLIENVPEKDGVQTTIDEAEAAIVLPPNLQWLEKPTPFSANLSTIVEELSAAKQRVIFTLDQHRLRQKEYRSQLDAEEYGIEVEKENLRKLDDTIAACALVAEQSGKLQPDLLVVEQIHHKHHSAQKAVKTSGPRLWTSDDPTMCHQADVIRFFDANPNTNWTAPEIRKLLPAAKQAHAKKHVNVILAALNNLGTIRRVGTGIYRMDKA